MSFFLLFGPPLDKICSSAPAYNKNICQLFSSFDMIILDTYLFKTETRIWRIDFCFSSIFSDPLYRALFMFCKYIYGVVLVITYIIILMIMLCNVLIKVQNKWNFYLKNRLY